LEDAEDGKWEKISLLASKTLNLTDCQEFTHKYSSTFGYQNLKERFLTSHLFPSSRERPNHEWPSFEEFGGFDQKFEQKNLFLRDRTF